MIAELTKRDWETAKKHAETMIKQAQIDLVIAKNLFNTATQEILNAPSEEAAGVG